MGVRHPAAAFLLGDGEPCYLQRFFSFAQLRLSSCRHVRPALSLFDRQSSRRAGLGRYGGGAPANAGPTSAAATAATPAPPRTTTPHSLAFECTCESCASRAEHARSLRGRRTPF